MSDKKNNQNNEDLDLDLDLDLELDLDDDLESQLNDSDLDLDEDISSNEKDEDLESSMEEDLDLSLEEDELSLDEESLSLEEEELSFEDDELSLDEDSSLEEEVSLEEEEDLSLEEDGLSLEEEISLEEDLSLEEEDVSLEEEEEDLSLEEEDVSLEEEEEELSVEEDSLLQNREEDLLFEEDNGLSDELNVNLEERLGGMSYIEEEYEEDLLNQELSEETTKENSLGGELMDEEIKREKKGSKTKLISSVLVVSIVAVLVAGFIYKQNRPVESNNNLLTQNQEEVQLVKSEAQIKKEQEELVNRIVEQKLSGYENKITKLELENEEMKKELDKKSSEMGSFNMRLNDIQNKPIVLSQKQREEIASAVNKETDKKLKSFVDKIAEIESNTAKNEENIKKSFKVSVGALKTVNENKEATQKTLSDIKKEVDSNLNTNKNQDLIKRINELENKIKEVENVGSKANVSLPLEIDVKDGVNNTTNIVKKEVRQEIVNKKVYILVGVFDQNTVYLRDASDSDSLPEPFSVGDELDGYGKITKIHKSGRVDTESGMVKNK